MDKDGTNAGNLRKERDEANAKVKELSEKIDKELKDLSQKIDSKEFESSIKALSGGDPEVEKKIKYHMGRLSQSGDNPEQQQKNLEDAVTLATGRRMAPSAFNGILSAAGGDPSHKINDPEAGGPLKPELVGLAKNLGLSDKDINKYGKK